ncbi:MAG: hypothetical protein H6637_08385 [Ardenticatenales bacterium]|nr:hypothetical protein [Ardenticatenales bacterium]
MAKSEWARRNVWWLIPLLALPALWPFYTGGFFQSADGVIHLFRLITLDDSIRQGMIYPRWSSQLLQGYGYPVFNFYAPASYYIAELFHQLGASFTESLIITTSLYILFAGWGMYQLARVLLPAPATWGPWIAATLYMYSPYLIINAYTRGAIAEVGAQALLPWIFLLFYRLFTIPRPHQWAIPTALLLSLLVVMHNITLLLLPPFLALYALLLWRRGGYERSALFALVGAGSAALGISAFFWLPLVMERSFLLSSAYDISARYLPQHLWNWRNFIDHTLLVDHSLATPLRLGLIQGLLALVGALVALRYDSERRSLWAYGLAVVLICMGGISPLSRPFWLSHPLPLIVQFPWRLLSIATVPLTLFVAVLPLALRKWHPRLERLAPLLLLLIIVTHLPRLEGMQRLPRQDQGLGMATISQYENDPVIQQVSAFQEFLPRWANLGGEDKADNPEGTLSIQMVRAGSWGIEAAVVSSRRQPLRLTNFYYPGWVATTDKGRTLAVAPSARGLLEIDLPEGRYGLIVRWKGTETSRIATWISLFSLVILALVAYRYQLASRKILLMLGILALLGLGTQLLPPPRMAAVAAAQQPFEQNGIALMGYQYERSSPRQLALYPYWHVRERPTASALLWTLRDPQWGEVARLRALPYYNTISPSEWSPNSVVDDAYLWALPSGLAAGAYELWVEPVTEAAPSERDDAVPVGTVTLAQSVPPVPPPSEALYTFNDQIALRHVAISLNGTPVSPPELLVVQPGDLLTYEIAWQAMVPLAARYRVLVGLFDGQQQAMVQRDQFFESVMSADRLLNKQSDQDDHYELRIPTDAQAGLYTPEARVYDYDTGMRAWVRGAESNRIVEGAVLMPPIKVLVTPHVAPQTLTEVRFANGIELVGYDLTPKAVVESSSAAFDLVLYFRNSQPLDKALTRFVHLYDDSSKLIAQADGPPSEGRNPTSAWLPDELIVDAVTIELPDNLVPGAYALVMGFYDATQPHAPRLSVSSGGGDLYQEGAVFLQTITLTP